MSTITDQTLDDVQRRYPNLAMAPYRGSMASRAASSGPDIVG